MAISADVQQFYASASRNTNLRSTITIWWCFYVLSHLSVLRLIRVSKTRFGAGLSELRIVLVCTTPNQPLSSSSSEEKNKLSVIAAKKTSRRHVLVAKNRNSSVFMWKKEQHPLFLWQKRRNKVFRAKTEVVCNNIRDNPSVKTAQPILDRVTTSHHHRSSSLSFTRG